MLTAISTPFTFFDLDSSISLLSEVPELSVTLIVAAVSEEETNSIV